MSTSAKDECDLAIKDCNKAIKLKPDYAEAYYNRAVAYGKKNEIDRAIADFSTAYNSNLIISPPIIISGLLTTTQASLTVLSKTTI